MKPLNWIPGLLVCAFWLSVNICAQNSIKEPLRSAPAITITAHARPALIAQIYDSHGHLENSVTSLENDGKSVLTIDAWSDSDLTLATSEGFFYLRRVEITVRFAGFRSETARINLSVTGSHQSATTTWVEGPSPDSVLPIDANRTKPIADPIRSGNRLIRYVGVFVRQTTDLSFSEVAKCQLLYEVRVP